MALIEADHTRGEAGGASYAHSPLRDWVRALEATAPIAQHPHRLLADVIAEQARRHGDAPALISRQGSLTYRELVARARRYARWALAQHIGKGAAVGLMLPNCADYMAIWLGISWVGGVASLINTQLRGASLSHCIENIAPAHLIVGADCIGEVEAAGIDSAITVWAHGGGDRPRIDRMIEALSAEALAPAERRDVGIADRALTIHTSGTTGLPKAAVVSHRRLLQWSLWFAGVMNTGPQDRMYDCLPMYHSIGGVVATGALLTRGGSVLVREKFSAREFWDDVVDGDCTLFQYIGELARYLVNGPRHPRERAHRLRIACGNGMRADVWQQFQARFAIPRILEFYAATEGNVSLYNVEGEVGAIGRVPPFLAHRFPLALVKFDPATGQPARDATGRCIRCATGEAGEALGRIESGARNGGMGVFEGYTSAAETDLKIVRDAFAPGDAWYRTGDLMRADARGFYYFVDRIGDTFRWKGENVAASEVAAALTAYDGIGEASVYGVAVPDAEGKAGVATVVAAPGLDLVALRAHLAQRLPDYARPLFLRVAGAIVATSTFKHDKTALACEGFDPATIRDPLYFDDRARGAYVRLDADLYRRITAGEIRL